MLCGGRMDALRRRNCPGRAIGMPLFVLALLAHEHFVKAQYAYHSASPYGPWSPVRVATPNGVQLPPGDIWFGPHCQRTKGDPAAPINPLSCGGNNPSPYFVTHETAAATGFPVRPI